MSVKEKLSRFWNETLGVDCPDEVNIEESRKPEDKELIESLGRVNDLEKKYRISTTSSNKGGKTSKFVDKVETNSKEAMEKAEEKAAQKDSKVKADKTR